MGVDCGSQITICDMPIHFDNYIGCSHACEYCFVKRFKDIKKIKPVKGSYNSLKASRRGIDSETHSGVIGIYLFIGAVCQTHFSQ